MTIKTPMTVADLIVILQGFPVDAVVMIDCEDEYYSGPVVADDLENGRAALIGPFAYQTPSEDDRGRPVTPRTRQAPGGWTKDEGDNFSGEVLQRSPAVFIRATR